MDYYKVVRYFANGKKYTIHQRLTLEEAQAHCKNPETCSETATSATAKARTRRCGDWFDGFTKA
jgi:hypothetical protein